MQGHHWAKDVQNVKKTKTSHYNKIERKVKAKIFYLKNRRYKPDKNFWFLWRKKY